MQLSFEPELLLALLFPLNFKMFMLSYLLCEQCVTISLCSFFLSLPYSVREWGIFEHLFIFFIFLCSLCILHFPILCCPSALISQAFVEFWQMLIVVTKLTSRPERLRKYLAMSFNLFALTLWWKMLIVQFRDTVYTVTNYLLHIIFGSK